MDASVGAGDTSGMGKKVSNNTNNTSESQLGRIDRVDKGGLSGTIKEGVGGTNIKAGIEMGGANKGGTIGTDIEQGKKAGAGAVASIDNIVNGDGKVTD